MKKIVGLALVIVLIFAMAIPAVALSLIPPEDYNCKVWYTYIDYSREGIPTLFMYGGERGGYKKDWPEVKMYTYIDGKVHRFQPSEESETELNVFIKPYGYRNKQTGELKWFAKSGFRGWGGITVHEVIFDYQNYLYTIVKFAHIDDKWQDSNEWLEVDDNYNEWVETWELEVTGEHYETRPYHNTSLVYQLLRKPGPAPQFRLLMHVHYLLYRLFNW